MPEVMRTILTAAVLVMAASTVFAQTRHALVIGIDDYAHVTPLQKARNDAQAVSAALERLGFVVITEIEPDRRQMNQALSAFSSQLEPGDEALFYFAGHGVEVAGRNYLLPADIPAARPGDEDFVISEAIAVDRVLNMMQRRGTRVSLLILDACRDNPFPTEGARSLGSSRGLARVDPPEGAFILFSAGTGQAALDRLSDNDPDPNSVFTRALLPRIVEPGLDIHTLARDVRRDVRMLARQANHDQFPSYYDQLAGNFSFNPRGLPAAAPVPIVQPQPASPVTECESARRDWALIEGVEIPEIIEAFIVQYADCLMLGALASAWLTALQEANQQTTVGEPAFILDDALRGQITAFVTRHLVDWSGPREKAMARVHADYAENVLFYNNRWYRSDVIQDKEAFVNRWPQREYRLEPGSLAASCREVTRRCNVVYSVTWEARSPQRNARSAGRSRVDIVLEYRASGFVIVEENGSVLQRF